jgi:hypothetical protein
MESEDWQQIIGGKFVRACERSVVAAVPDDPRFKHVLVVAQRLAEDVFATAEASVRAPAEQAPLGVLRASA